MPAAVAGTACIPGWASLAAEGAGGGPRPAGVQGAGSRPADGDEGAGRVVELVDVGLEPAVPGLLEQERERLVALLRLRPEGPEVWRSDALGPSQETCS